MVAHFCMRIYGVNKEFVEGNWLSRKSCQILFFFGKDFFISYVLNMFKLPSYICTMPYPLPRSKCPGNIIYKFNTKINDKNTFHSEDINIEAFLRKDGG